MSAIKRGEEAGLQEPTRIPSFLTRAWSSVRNGAMTDSAFLKRYKGQLEYSNPISQAGIDLSGRHAGLGSFTHAV